MSNLKQQINQAFAEILILEWRPALTCLLQAGEFLKGFILEDDDQIYLAIESRALSMQS